jgi:hypothetical protein
MAECKRRLHASGPEFVKCVRHGGAVDNSRAEKMEHAHSSQGQFASTPQSPIASEARLAGTGHRDSAGLVQLRTLHSQ